MIFGVATITNPTTYATPTTGYIQTNLVSDVPDLAPNVNPKLINPWGFSENSNGQFRVAANGTGRGILLDAQGEIGFRAGESNEKPSRYRF